MDDSYNEHQNVKILVPMLSLIELGKIIYPEIGMFSDKKSVRDSTTTSSLGLQRMCKYLLRI